MMLSFTHRLADWLAQHSLPCFYYKYLGIPCPGCGMQRAFIELLSGNLWKSLCLYPALIPMMFMLTLLVLHLIWHFKHGAMVLKYSFIFTAAIVLFHYIYLLFNL